METSAAHVTLCWTEHIWHDNTIYRDLVPTGESIDLGVGRRGDMMAKHHATGDLIQHRSIADNRS